MDSSHSDWHVMVPHCGFDLHFSDNEWCWASFHVIVSHLYVFFGERSVFWPIFWLGHLFLDFPCGSDGKDPPAMRETWVWSFGLRRSPGEEKGYSLHCSCLRIPRTEEPGGLQSVGSQRVRHDWAPFTFTFKYSCYYKAQSFFHHFMSVIGEFFHINMQRASSFLLL